MAPGAMDQWTYGYMFRAVKETNKSRCDKLGVRNVPFGIIAEYVKCILNKNIFRYWPLKIPLHLLFIITNYDSFQLIEFAEH